MESMCKEMKTTLENSHTIYLYLRSNSGKTILFVYDPKKLEVPEASAASPFRSKKSRPRLSKSVKKPRNLKSKSKSKRSPKHRHH